MKASNLRRLFAYVAEDTETFLILGSPAILTRKWCIGEMNTARSNGVKTFLLAWPNFVAPDEAFILNYANMVPDIRELTKYGVSLSNVEETFRWLSGVGRIELPDLITSESISNTIMAFTDAGSPARTEKHPQSPKGPRKALQPVGQLIHDRFSVPTTLNPKPQTHKPKPHLTSSKVQDLLRLEARVLRRAVHRLPHPSGPTESWLGFRI